MKKVVTFILLLIITSCNSAQSVGHLVIIGGGSIPDYIIEKYVELAGGRDAKFLIVPMASSQPFQSMNSFSKRLFGLGCTNIESIIGNNESIDVDSNLAKINDVKGVFFTGGDQSNLTSALLDTKLLEAIKKIYLKGGVIGGTSAGAAVMSSLMITGEELINNDTVNVFNLITQGNIKTSKGFGLLNNAIVDQHFIKRKRMNRLISLVLENPNLIGIGIDESTAIIMDPTGTFEVLGESLVMIFDAKNAKEIKLDKNNHQAAKNIKLHLLKSGDKYSLSD